MIPEWDLRYKILDVIKRLTARAGYAIRYDHESYEYQDFDLRELSLIEPLRAMRMVHYLAWVLKRWNDPAFPRAFVWFKEQDFLV